MTTFRITTPRQATFGISGIPTRDAASLANTKRALVTDAKTSLRDHLAEVNGPDGPVPSFEVTDSLKVITEPTCVFADDDSVTRTSGVATLTVVVTARA
jgi:hypothetical protein